MVLHYFTFYTKHNLCYSINYEVKHCISNELIEGTFLCKEYKTVNDGDCDWKRLTGTVVKREVKELYSIAHKEKILTIVIYTA